jgi:hypothetical protein
MVQTLVRVILAFITACLAAAVVQVFFAISPAEIASGKDGANIVNALTVVPRAMIQSFLFAAPFVLVAAAVAEWQSIRDWIYYTLVGIAIAFAGFTALHMGEGTDRTLMHDYAMRAYLAAGAAAGFFYWMAGGRDAGNDHEPSDIIPPPIRDPGSIASRSKTQPGAGIETQLASALKDQQVIPARSSLPTQPSVQTAKLESSTQSALQQSSVQARPAPPPPPSPPPLPGQSPAGSVPQTAPHRERLSERLDRVEGKLDSRAGGKPTDRD